MMSKVCPSLSMHVHMPVLVYLEHNPVLPDILQNAMNSCS